MLEICDLTKDTDEYGLLYGDYALSYLKDIMGKEYEISEDRIISFRGKEGQLFVVFEDERRCLEWRTGDL